MTAYVLAGKRSHRCWIQRSTLKTENLSRSTKYRVSVKSFPDYKHLLQENYVEYKHIFLP